MGQPRNATRGVASAIALVALVVGAPLLLVVLAGVPFASGLPSLDEFSETFQRQMTYNEINVLLAIVGWTLWAQFVWCVAVEVKAWRENRSPQRVPLAVGSQTLARTLVLSVIVLLGSFARPSATPNVHLVSEPAVAVAEAPSDSPVAASPDIDGVEQSVTVKPRDDLWSIAQAHLGDPLRWHEIFELNKGVPQKDGRSLQQGHLIRPGWVMKLPADAVGAEAPQSEPQPTEPVIESAPPAVATTSIVPSVVTEVPAPAPAGDEAAETKTDSSLPAGLVASGVSAAGLLLALTTMRRVQQRRRRPGQVVAAPDESLAPVETALRIAADASDATRLDIASRALGFWLSEGDCDHLPAIEAVRIGADGIEFLFADSVDAPHGPFSVTQNQRAWTLPNDVHEVRVGSMAQLMSALMPTLSTVGTVDEATVMIDLEAALWTTVAGPVDVARQFVDALVMELATNVWSDYLTLIVVGGDERQARFERVTYCASLEEATPYVDAGAGIARQMEVPTTLQGRIVPGNDGWAPTILVMRDDVDVSAVRALIAKDDLSVGKGIAVVTVGECADADRTISINGECIEIAPPGIAVARSGLATVDASAVHDLFDQAEAEPIDVPASLIDLRDQSSGDEVAEPRIRLSDSAAEVVVRVLGPVTIEGGNEPIDRPKSVELVAYLALHPGGVTDDRLKTALWPEKRVSPGSFHSTTSRARSRLGESRSGEPHLPPVSGGLYRTGGSIASDVELFERACRETESASRIEKTDLLASALEYVRGAPFADTSRGYQWAYNEGIVGHLESTVANAAHTLADLAFEMGDNERGHWAAKQGVLASPGWEPLYRLRMIAYDKEGNPAGVRAVMDELVEVVEAIEPYDSLHPETVELWQRLDPRQRLTKARR